MTAPKAAGGFPRIAEDVDRRFPCHLSRSHPLLAATPRQPFQGSARDLGHQCTLINPVSAPLQSVHRVNYAEARRFFGIHVRCPVPAAGAISQLSCPHTWPSAVVLSASIDPTIAKWGSIGRPLSAMPPPLPARNSAGAVRASAQLSATLVFRGAVRAPSPKAALHSFNLRPTRSKPHPRLRVFPDGATRWIRAKKDARTRSADRGPLAQLGVITIMEESSQ